MIGYALVIIGLAVLFSVNPLLGIGATCVVAGFNMVLLESFKRSARAVSEFAHATFARKE